MQLKLSIKQIKALQAKHGIANLLQPTPEEAGKLANADFLVDFNLEGSRKFEGAPDRDAVEEMDVAELVGPIRGISSRRWGETAERALGAAACRDGAGA